MWWLWGSLGAFVYGVNVLIFALWDEGRSRFARIRATAEFGAALITGAVFAQGFTPTLHSVAVQWLKVDAIAVALTIGWASNYLWPKLLRKLGERVDRLDVKGTGP